MLFLLYGVMVFRFSTKTKIASKQLYITAVLYIWWKRLVTPFAFRYFRTKGSIYWLRLDNIDKWIWHLSLLHEFFFEKTKGHFNNPQNGKSGMLRIAANELAQVIQCFIIFCLFVWGGGGVTRILNGLIFWRNQSAIEKNIIHFFKIIQQRGPWDEIK